MIPPHKKHEKSFTLIETLIALGIMVTLVLQIGIVQGQSITFSDYGRQMTKAVWLAKALMSKIEYQSKRIPLKEMKYNQKEGTFEELLCPKEGSDPCQYTHNVVIENWKLDLLDIFFKQKPKENGGEGNPMMDMMKDQLKQYLGEELISYAHVEVFWPEGARKNSVDLALLLTNQMGLDETLQSFPPLEDEGSKPAGGGSPSPGDSNSLDGGGDDEEFNGDDEDGG